MHRGVDKTFNQKLKRASRAIFAVVRVLFQWYKLGDKIFGAAVGKLGTKCGLMTLGMTYL